MAYNPRQPRNKDGEWTDTGGGGGGSSAPGRFAYLAKNSGPAPLPGETEGQRNLRLAYEAERQGIAPPNVVGADARRLYETVMAKAQRDNPTFVQKGAKRYKASKTRPSANAFTGATDATRKLPASDPIFQKYRNIGMAMPHAPAVGTSGAVKAPAIRHVVNGAHGAPRRSR